MKRIKKTKKHAINKHINNNNKKLIIDETNK